MDREEKWEREGAHVVKMRVEREKENSTSFADRLVGFVIFFVTFLKEWV